MDKIILIGMGVAVIVLTSTVGDLMGATTPPSWLEHMDVILPIIKEAATYTIKAISALIGAIGFLLWGIGRRWMSARKKDHLALMADNARLERKIDEHTTTVTTKFKVIQGIMMNCKGCSTAAVEYAKQMDALEVLDDASNSSQL